MKRFTETTKWQDAWFYGLAPEEKLAWLYLVDLCDHAGVFELVPSLANNMIGFEVDWEVFLRHAGDRINKLSNGKFHITKFVGYQFGPLNPKSNLHKAVINALIHNGIPMPSGCHTDGIAMAPSKGKGKGKGKGEVKEKEKEKARARGGENLDALFARFWNVVHRKIAPDNAKKAFSKALTKIAKERDWRRDMAATWLTERMRLFAASNHAKDDIKGTVHPASWLNRGSYDDDAAIWDEVRGSVGNVQTFANDTELQVAKRNADSKEKTAEFKRKQAESAKNYERLEQERARQRELAKLQQNEENYP